MTGHSTNRLSKNSAACLAAPRLPADGIDHPARWTHLRLALAALAGLTAFAPLLGSLTVSAQLAAVALPIGILGVMHGALDPWVGDHVLAQRIGQTRRGPWNPVLISAYLGLMGLVVLSWVIAPRATLVAFLAISVLHFGAQDGAAVGQRGDRLATLVLGALPVLGPFVAHPGDVALILGWLVGLDPDTTAPLLRWLLNPVVALWIVGCSMLISRMLLLHEAGLGRALVLLAVITPAMLLLPPLVAFAAYFCLVHSFGHLVDLHVAGEGPWRAWRPADWLARLWPATLGAFGLGAAGWLWIGHVDPAAVPTREALARAVFCGLAALTVPHVALHALARRTVPARHRAATAPAQTGPGTAPGPPAVRPRSMPPWPGRPRRGFRRRSRGSS